ncbi:MAG: universal stress protein [Bacillota bacterium]|nr:universal stress protein [Bacillota bacterium]MDW7683522.1 universal stress protein [Bacillota bacterium]
MFNKIVMATDGSERSMRVAQVAGSFACKNPGCKVYILYVVHELPTFVTSILENADIHYGGHMKETAKDIFKRTVDAMGVDTHDVEVHTILEYGKPAKEIIKMAKDVDADLIVIGNSNISEAEEFLTGAGISHKILHHAPCHVLVVK